MLLLPSALASSLLDWGFHAGETVGAVQLGRPALAFRRFVFVDLDAGFVPRE